MKKQSFEVTEVIEVTNIKRIHVTQRETDYTDILIYLNNLIILFLIYEPSISCVIS